MKKLVLAGLASALVLGTPLVAMAKWVDKTADGVGMTIKVNDTFKVTKDTKTEADLVGTIYKHPAQIVMGKDTSMDWSKSTDKEILAALVKGLGQTFSGFTINNQGKGGIGNQDGRYAAFDAVLKGHPMHGYLEFAVVEGNLYSVYMFYGVGGDKTEDVASKMVNSADFVN